MSPFVVLSSAVCHFLFLEVLIRDGSLGVVISRFCGGKASLVARADLFEMPGAADDIGR
jgi:hypothetical protein